MRGRRFQWRTRADSAPASTPLSRTPKRRRNNGLKPWPFSTPDNRAGQVDDAHRTVCRVSAAADAGGLEAAAKQVLPVAAVRHARIDDQLADDIARGVLAVRNAF